MAPQMRKEERKFRDATALRLITVIVYM